DLGSLRRGEGLYLLGYPLGKAWRINTTPEKLAETGESLDFESNFIARGHSGGALLDENRNIVGMLKSDNPPYGQATSITAIMRKLRQWGYPVDLGTEITRVTFTTVSVGRGRACGITDTGSAYCWGNIGTDHNPVYQDDPPGSRIFTRSAVRVRGGLAFQTLSV